MFLISDPMPREEADFFVINIDGDLYNSEAQVDGDQSRLHFELPSLSFGTHIVKVQANNKWEGGYWSDPFEFVVVLPGKVSGLGLSEG